jgi:predicted lipoprotein with Yx(FWY)xxD motif
MQISLRVILIIPILVLASMTPIHSIGTKEDSTSGYLTDNDGKTLYYFVDDDPYSGISNCYGGCQSEWIPVYESNIPQGLNSQDFGTITRSNGDLQTTYRGRPLYRYQSDKESGDRKGEGKYGLWYIMRI